LIPAAASNATMPPGNSIRPASGVNSPAAACNVSDFPHPDGPKSTTNSLPAVNDGSS
jgi:hypothetical protein